MIKSPKPYFFDTGLLCYLLRIQNIDQLENHPMRGQIFENWVIVEKYKNFFNNGKEAPLYFWRDSKGHEVDLVIDQGQHLFPIEIRSSATFHPDFIEGLDYFNQLQGFNEGEVILGAIETTQYKNYRIKSWKEV